MGSGEFILGGCEWFVLGGGGWWGIYFGWWYVVMDLFLGDCGWSWVVVDCGKFIWGRGRW